MHTEQGLIDAGVNDRDALRALTIHEAASASREGQFQSLDGTWHAATAVQEARQRWGQSREMLRQALILVISQVTADSANLHELQRQFAVLTGAHGLTQDEANEIWMSAAFQSKKQ